MAWIDQLMEIEELEDAPLDAELVTRFDAVVDFLTRFKRHQKASIYRITIENTSKALCYNCFTAGHVQGKRGVLAR